MSSTKFEKHKTVKKLESFCYIGADNEIYIDYDKLSKEVEIAHNTYNKYGSVALQIDHNTGDIYITVAKTRKDYEFNRKK